MRKHYQAGFLYGFEKLFVEARSQSLLESNTRSIGIYYDAPFTQPVEELKSHACISLPADSTDRTNFEVLKVEGEHAVLHHVGPYSKLEQAYTWFYGEWLLKPGREAGDAPVFEEYLNDPKTVPPMELETLIYLPLAK